MIPVSVKGLRQILSNNNSFIASKPQLRGEADPRKQEWLCFSVVEAFCLAFASVDNCKQKDFQRCLYHVTSVHVEVEYLMWDGYKLIFRDMSFRKFQ